MQCSVRAMVALAVVCLAALPAAGEEETTAGLAQVIAPYVDNQTVAIVHVDLSRLPSTQAVGMLAEFLRLAPGQRDRLQAEIVPLNVLADSLQPDAPADVFTVHSISDITSLPLLFVIPLESPAQVISQELRRAINAQVKFDVATEQIGAALVTGSTRAIERVKRARPQQRAEVAAAFLAAGQGSLQLLFVPSADALRAIEVLYPRLPEELGGGPTKLITAQVRWVAVGLDFPSQKVHLRVVVQAADEAAARSLADGTASLLESLAEKESGAAVDANFAALVKRLMPDVSGDRLTVELVADESEMAALGRLFAPVLETLAGLASGGATARPAKSN